MSSTAANDVLVAGVGLTRFGAHGPGRGVALGTEAAVAALADAGITFRDVDLMYAGTAHPLSPRGVFVARELGLTGIPVQMLSSASATGLACVHEAKRAVESGQADVVLVVAYDSPQTDVATEDVITGEGHAPPVVSFALWAAERAELFGTTPEHLAAVAAKNWNYARENPLAARRAPEPVTADRVLGSRMVASPLTSMMCTPWGEGGGAVVLCSRSGAERLGISPAVRLASSERATDRFGPRQVLEGAIVGPPDLTRATARHALAEAGVDADAVDVVQVHDAFAIEEILYYELLGFSSPGRTEELVEQGAFGPGSRSRFGLPEFSTDGGLIARGHPGGPTGIAQVAETVRRLTTTSDQVGLCHLLGGGSVCVVQVYTGDGGQE